MILRIVIIFSLLAGLTYLIFYSAVDHKREAKKARLVIENHSGETITKVVATLIGEPCRIQSIENGDRAECIFTDLDTSNYAITFTRSNGEKINKTNLGLVKNGLFWDDKITLGEGGEIEMTRGLPVSNRVDFTTD